MLLLVNAICFCIVYLPNFAQITSAVQTGKLQIVYLPPRGLWQLKTYKSCLLQIQTLKCGQHFKGGDVEMTKMRVNRWRCSFCIFLQLALSWNGKLQSVRCPSMCHCVPLCDTDTVTHILCHRLCVYSSSWMRLPVALLCRANCSQMLMKREDTNSNETKWYKIKCIIMSITIKIDNQSLHMLVELYIHGSFSGPLILVGHCVSFQFCNEPTN